MKKRHPWLTKLAALGGITLLLLWGLGLIADIVRDRQSHRSQAVQSVADSLAGPQTLLGPLIHMACVESWDDATAPAERRGEQRREFRLTAMPERLVLRTDVALQERARGLHKVPAYQTQTRISAQWDTLASLQPQRQVQGSRLQCGQPILMVAVSDARGIRNARLQQDGQTLALKPGTFHPTYARGLHAVLPAALAGSSGGFAATLDLELVGTERWAVVPLGSTTEVSVQGPWPHPSFGGRFLPTERQVSDAGFRAQWRLSSLATTAQQDVERKRRLCDPASDTGADAATPAEGPNAAPRGCVDSFSVALVDPVNPYTLSDRATKYGLLFVALTFVAVGLFELLLRLRVHPVQYLLVGSALCSFFLLLVSLSEHLPFGWAYGVAASACVALLTYYASHMLGRLSRGLPLGGGIALLYGLLYLLLQLEQTALAVGSIALFAVLTAVMVLTRKVDWYGLAPARADLPEKRPPPPAPPTSAGMQFPPVPPRGASPAAGSA